MESINPAPVDQIVLTPVGPGRITWYEARQTARAVLALGHGSATGIEAADLQALARALPSIGVTVALVTYPYRQSGGWGSSDANLDISWTALWPEFEKAGLPVIAGGRSAGSQVACRTSRTLGARGVLALAYPLNGPGSASELLATGVPTLIIQGGNDPYGRPAEFPALPPTMELVAVPGGNHTFGTSSHEGRAAALDIITSATEAWVDRIIISSFH